MTRRIFIALSLYLFTKSISAKELSPTYWQIIDDTLNHLFPKSDRFNSASKLNFINFFKLLTNDKYFQRHSSLRFDKDDLKLLINGSKELYKIDKNYLNLTVLKKESLLRKFEKTQIGQQWLSTLLYYGFEGMLSDPIYGGNKNMNGWKALNHNAGFPRPKKRYGKVELI